MDEVPPALTAADDRDEFGRPKSVLSWGQLLAVTAYGEFRSISAFVERTPGFRHLDSIGRI